MRFGTDGVRGRTGSQITATLALHLGGAVARELGPRIAVAHDGRPGAQMLTSGVIAGVCAAGGVPVRCGRLPTPALALLVAREGLDGGVMVTASHNPARDNGFKVFERGGQKPGEDRRRRIEEGLAVAPAGDVVGEPRDHRDPGWTWREGISALLLRDFPTAGHRWLRGRTLVLDSANGAAVGHGARLLVSLGARVWSMGDGSGELINAGVGALHPATAAEAVVAEGADLGIVLDGDGDRLVLVTPAGRVVDGDGILWLLADGSGPVVGTVMSNGGLEAGLAVRGVTLVRTPVGDAQVAAAVRREGASVGAEPSGHVLFADGPPGSDGVYTALRVLLSVPGRLDDALAGYHPHVQAHRNLRVDDRHRAVEAAAQVTVELGDQGCRVVVRPSGTEPVLRVMVEHPEAATAQAGLDRVLAAIGG